MNKIEQLYSAIKQLEDLGLPISQEQLDVIKCAEGEYIDDEIIPIITEAVSGKLDNIRHPFTLTVEFDKEHNICINRVGKTVVCNDVFSASVQPTLGKRAQNLKTYILRVTFPDGKIICHNKVSETFVETVMYIGVDKVESLGIEVLGKNIITSELFDVQRYRSSQYDLGNGKYLTTAGDSDRRMATIKRISNELNLGLLIEKVDL